MKNLHLTIICFLACISSVLGQKVILDGYVFEKYNRGFLNEVKISIFDKSDIFIGETQSDINGHFTFEVPAGKEYSINFDKKVFANKREKVNTEGKADGEKVFIKAELERQPGYLLEVTLAEKRLSDMISVDAVNGSRIEIYNNTLKKEELVIDSAKSPVFSFTLQQGNEYTILIRKKGFFNKRLHANVNINGCYLCMDGFGTVNPGVVSNLTAYENNQLGTLIANVELERIDTNRNIVLKNIYYGYNSASITDYSKKELDKLIVLLRNNPALIVELGSHTDSRGGDESNLRLSQQRAQAAVDYITASDLVSKNKLKARGYGESKLVNKCSDGVPCSEEQHLQNRRTELKVIGFTYDSFADKSLLEIMHDEEMSQFVKSGESDKEYVPTLPPQSTNPNETPTHTRMDNFDDEKANKTTENNAEMPKKDINLLKIGDYSGYKIELFTSKSVLQSTDMLLQKVGNEIATDIFYETNADNEISYLFGYFQGWTETENALKKINQKYPDARIVEYFKGKRL